MEPGSSRPLWEPMTVDEFADFEIANGAEVIKVDGIWWRRVRPFFYRPLFPFQEIMPGAARPPRKSLLGGFQHAVPEGAAVNSEQHFFIYDDIRDYSLETVRHVQRKNIKRGIGFFETRSIENVREFISAGYPVYRSFYERTGYGYKKERIDKKHFTHWAEAIFRFPKVLKLGAYHDGELCAVDISYVVEDVLFDATLFSKTEYLKRGAVDLLFHVILQEAARCLQIAFVYKGAVTGHQSLDFSKIVRGCRIYSKPAMFRLNPLVHLLARTFLKQDYRKLLGQLDGMGAGKPESLQPVP